MSGTKHLFKVTARVPALDDPSLGIFDTCTGGDTDSTDTRHHSGGMGPEEALGGPATVTNITITRRFKPDRDGPLRGKLRPLCGKTLIHVTKQPLDPDGHPIRQAEVFTGVLKRFMSPEHDSDSGDLATMELELAPNETVGMA